jgi:hypothetical protein
MNATWHKVAPQLSRKKGGTGAPQCIILCMLAEIECRFAQAPAFFELQHHSARTS